MIAFNGPAAVDVYAMAVLASGLRLYAKTKVKPNAVYTPSKMLALAAHYTGRAYKRGEYLEAADALSALIAHSAANLPEGNTIR